MLKINFLIVLKFIFINLKTMEINVIKENDIYDTFFCYIPNFIDDKKIINWLESMNDFLPSNNYNEKIGRYQKWYQKDKEYFCNKWKTKYKKWESFDYEKFLIEIQEKVQEKINSIDRSAYKIKSTNINSCLINKYRNGNDYITAHRDTKISFGEYPTIAGLSLGSERKIIFRRNNDNEIISFNLESGSLFIMGGCSQKNYTHEIPTCNTNEVRYSLTFREFNI